ncbi:uncharacterized protein LOC129901260 [Solanum dulcamara]|uniref:uncharacterized protein LOC129901260 n=1 Tax=Solanum dulcamara TaxID=45834 RepID=UPI0024866964|nr:uncharacterized protein LOC129901260 [Solanum dulcamara]
MSGRQVCLMSTTINSDDEDDNNFFKASAFPRKSRTSFGHNHHSLLDSSESEDDQGHRQPRPINDSSSLLRMMLNINQRDGAGAGAGRSQLNFNRNRPTIPDSSENEDDQGHHQPRPINDISSLLRMMLHINQRDGAGAGAGAGRSQLIINHNRRTIPDYSDSCTDDEGLSKNYHGKIKHFSHPHNLNKYNFQQYSKTNCKVCGLQLVGSGYGCESCQFYVHASCFDLPQKIQHDAHPAHPLTLRYPSYYKHCGKTCDACCENIRRSFLYCCDLCDFDLHVTCATLYNIVKRPDTLKGTLRLHYTFPFGDNIIARCNVCNKKVSKEGWLYYSKDTGHIAHINCVKDTVGPSWIKEKLNMLKFK